MWEDGILLLDRTTDRVDHPEEFYGLLAEVEPKHFWFSTRNRLILSTMREAMGPLAGRSVLDVGCGTGFVLAALERAGMVACGIDMHIGGLRYARERIRGPLLCGTATRLPFERQFDAVLLCDVIEHTPDDVAVVREASRALQDRGALVITVPAHPQLWTALDDVSGHKRRYTKDGLVQVMRRADLDVRLARYFNAALVPLQALQRWKFRHHPVATPADREWLVRQALQIPPRQLAALLDLAMRWELPLTRVLPFGASLIAIGARA